MTRELECGISQFTFGLPGETPPYIQSLWVSPDGYFYSFALQPAEVTHRAFLTATPVLKVLWILFQHVVLFLLDLNLTFSLRGAHFPESFYGLLFGSSEADILKGDFDESQENWVPSMKRTVVAAWTGLTRDDFGFFLNGFNFVALLIAKRVSVVFGILGI